MIPKISIVEIACGPSAFLNLKYPQIYIWFKIETNFNKEFLPRINTDASISEKSV